MRLKDGLSKESYNRMRELPVEIVDRKGNYSNGMSEKGISSSLRDFIVFVLNIEVFQIKFS